VWRRQLRLAHATDLIGRGVPPADVAEEVGYANAPAFSTMFRQALGFPPSRLTGGDRGEEEARRIDRSDYS
jgi:AraC-like DNA-binding protein